MGHLAHRFTESPARSLLIAGCLGVVTGCGGHVAGTSEPTSGGGSTSSTGGTGGTGNGAGAAGAAGGSGASGAGASAAGGAGGSAGSGPATAWCLNQLYQCGNGLDDDGDGLIDAADPDCLGVCDNDEGTLSNAIPCQKGTPCPLDCYFDHDCGPGNDDCIFDHQCDPNEVPPLYYPYSPYCAYNPDANIASTNKTCAELMMSQSDVCHTACDHLVPNGCDCFGCCELPAGSGNHVFIDSEDLANFEFTCTLDALMDPSKCHPCQHVPSCENPCEACELCVGKTTLEAGCPVQACAPGVTPCGLDGQSPCPDGFYCVTGCCQSTPLF